MIPWLQGDDPFPPVETALRSPDGLLAAGGDLSAKRLMEAYQRGVFPWFSAGEPILWWSPDPRMVFFPSEFRVSRSLAKILRNKHYEIRTDSNFEQVILNCAAPRRGQHGTWINDDMIIAYCELHRLGLAHSVETWINGELAGGLYGVSIGRMFFAESMFSKVSNASKIALAYLNRQFERWQNDPLPAEVNIIDKASSLASRPSCTQPAETQISCMIDCQMYTPHLATLGAREISRDEFIMQLKELVHYPPITDWQFDIDLFI